MKKTLLVLAVALAASTASASPSLEECSAVATKYASVDRFKMSIGELDTLRVCVSTQMELIVREADNAKADRAIIRSFGSKKFEDAE